MHDSQRDLANVEDLVFVVQKHKATSLHYDFRLEIGDVMPSWSVPKGPTLDNKVKRLAMETGDHELDYRHFEGVTPGGEYGAGTVMIWDQGTYRPEVEIEKGVLTEVKDPSEARSTVMANLKEGMLKFRLYGKKLQGSFALVRTKGMKGREAWLLIKHRDEYCRNGYDARDYDFSAVSGKSMDEIASNSMGDKED